jgi:hypothetical protein
MRVGRVLMVAVVAGACYLPNALAHSIKRNPGQDPSSSFMRVFGLLTLPLHSGGSVRSTLAIAKAGAALMPALRQRQRFWQSLPKPTWASTGPLSP